MYKKVLAIAEKHKGKVASLLTASLGLVGLTLSPEMAGMASDTLYFLGDVLKELHTGKIRVII